FMIAATLLGTLGVYLIEPFFGVAVYYLFAVLRPQFMWEWSLPRDVPWSFYVAVATLGAVLVKPKIVCFTMAHWAVLAFRLSVGISYMLAANQEVAYVTFVEYVKIFVMFAVSALFIRTVRQIWILMLLAAAALAYIAYEVNYHYFVNQYLGIYHNGYGGLDNN